MRYLLLSSILLFVTWSQVTAQVDRTNGVMVFNDTSQRYLYQNKINLYGHYVSGLMLIKPQGKGNYKVAMTTEFGAKILDFEFLNGEFILNDCIEDMRRKKILTLLESDMRLLLGIAGKDCRTIENDNNEVAYLKCQKRRVFKRYLMDANLGLVSKMFSGRKKKTDVEIELTDYKGTRPGKIELQHVKVPVSIEMKLL